MFVQVFQGPVSDPAKVKELLDRWVTDLSPGADGWLGSTSGVTGDDNWFIGFARFDSEDAARRNSERPEQGAWWGELEQLFTSEPAFHESSDIVADEHGDLDAAGFVQVMQGRTSDSARARELTDNDDPAWQDYRPDVLGSLMAVHGEDAWTMVIYFTSEADARAGEQKEPPESVREAMAELDRLAIGETTFLDLREPWLASPS